MEQVEVQNLGVKDPKLPGDQHPWPAAYQIHAYYSGDTATLNAQAMLELGDWINKHRGEIEQAATSPLGQRTTAAVKERLQNAQRYEQNVLAQQVQQ